MKQYYVIKNLRDNSYVAFSEDIYMNTISSAYEFDNEQDAIEYANRNFHHYFLFTIEKVYQITK